MIAVGSHNNERHTIKLSPCNSDAIYDIDDMEVIENDVYDFNWLYMFNRIMLFESI